MDPVQSRLALARASVVDFSVAEEPGWFSFNLEDRVVYGLRVFGDPGCSAVTHAVVSVRFRDEWASSDYFSAGDCNLL